MLTVAVENYQSFIDDALDEILEEHYEDLALDQDKVPLDPQFSVYREREKKGELLVMCMREQTGQPPASGWPPGETPVGELAGYFIGFIAPGLHYQTCLTCTMDIFYVRPKFRDNLLAGRRLFKAVERELRARSVARWFVGTKLNKDVGRLFESLKFTPVEMYYSKWLGD